MSNQIADGPNANYVQYWMNESFINNGQLVLDTTTKYRINITTTSSTPASQPLLIIPVQPPTPSAGYITVYVVGQTLTGSTLAKFAQSVGFTCNSSGVLAVDSSNAFGPNSITTGPVVSITPNSTVPTFPLAVYVTTVPNAPMLWTGTVEVLINTF